MVALLTDRLLDENGYSCRLAEKHLGVIVEQIARFTLTAVKTLPCWTSVLELALRRWQACT